MEIIKINFLFIPFISIFAILFGYESNWASFLGEWGTVPDKLEGLIVTIVFLVALLLYGIVMGYTEKKGFMKFISLYWGIGGSICLIAHLMAPIGKFAIIALPTFILIMVPTYGLRYFYTTGTNTLYLTPIISMISSWSAGAIGYLIGYLLKKLRVTRSGVNV
ncbi:hypothetical protein [Desulfosporosinus metallidurans]|uniref:Uncharacterized protein n=1 Tax=Desulfosporosinus metallidurans TaxID=1888891 RepID=A0A1Q8QLR1_9FIRM|nr:hypothetical protein [Desulfosporosinus metallidurans]OLN28270.1 hypothetical protein DSOL_4168 [Desulfosporosinus metallidurans]